MDDPTIGFIGAGSLGTALALGLSSSGYRVAAVNSRGNSSAAEVAARIPGCEAVRGPQHVADVCQLVFIATPDAAISEIATCVTWHRGQGVVHCSGVRPLGILEPAAVMGANTGSFHPFQTFACVSSPKEATNRLKGITFSVEGHGWVLSFLQTVASRLWSRAIRLSPDDRAIYHASAVMSCGLLVALLKAAGDLWQQMGVPQEEALATILPLAKSALANLSRAGVDASVTGPLVRGDTATVRQHLEAMESRLPRLIPLYCALSLESLPLAQKRMDKQDLEAMEEMLNDYLRRYVSAPRELESSTGT